MLCLSRNPSDKKSQPAGLFRTDGRRPDGLTLVPWQSGKSLCWDVTVICPLAESYVTGSQVLQRSLPLLAKRKKNASIGSDYHRGRNLGPDEHVSLPTLCQSGKKDLNLRRRQGRSFSVPESFGAGATLQR